MRFKLLIIGTLVFANLSANNRIIISGHIDNITDKTIRLTSWDLFEEDDIIKTSRIDKDGNYFFEIERMFAQDMMLTYDSFRITFFAHPGDSIHITTSNTGMVSSLFSGDSKEMNEHINEFIAKFNSFYPWEVVYQATKELSPIDFKKKLLDMQQDLRDSVIVFNNKYSTTKEFQIWTENYSKYSVYNDLMRFWWYKQIITKKPYTMNLPQGFFPFLYDTCKSENDNELFSCSKAFEYINEISTLFSSMEKMSVKKGVEKIIDKILIQTRGDLREIMIAKTFYSLLNANCEEEYSLFYPIFEQNVKNPLLIEIVDSKRKFEISLLDIPINENTVLFDSITELKENDLLNKVVTENKGKVIYIDFWGSYCSPCLKEMMISEQLKKEYKEKDIIFIYFCVQTRPDAWKKTIAQWGFTGNHYLLTMDQYNLFAEKFKINGVPHFVLIDKQGNIYDKNAVRPSDEKEFHKTIFELLK